MVQRHRDSAGTHRDTGTVQRIYNYHLSSHSLLLLTSRFFQNTDLPSEVCEMPHTQSTEQFKFVFLENVVKNGSLNKEFCLQGRS